MTPIRTLRRASALIASLAIVTGGMAEAAAAPTRTHPATPVTVAGLPPSATAGRGADVPFLEYEAEHARTNGRVIGPDRAYPTLAAEASGRRAVRLDRRHRFVEFTLAAPADAVTVRYAIPDAEDGSGRDHTLGVYVRGRRIAELATTSRYGWFYGSYPFTNDPADGTPHHFYDEARVRLARTLPAGTRVRLQVGEPDTAPWYVVDLADFELVGPPLAAPADALPVTDFGADPTGAAEASDAFDAAVAAGRAQGRPVWIPPGEFQINRHIIVDEVTLAGAGPWYAVLHGDGVGVYGNWEPNPSQRVTLRDFAIFGEVTERDDAAQVNGVGGAMGGGSLIENLWIQHTKVGLWFDGPMAGITIRGLRILDQTADALNFRRGVSNAVVEHTFARNTGDDALAMWSHLDADHHNAFRHNTIVAPILANGIAIYGGHDIEVTDNVVADTLTQGGGIHVGNRFAAVPVSGEITLARNTVVRAGVLDPNWQFGVGAVWFYALEGPMTAQIRLSDTALIDSSYEALQFIGDHEITGVTVDRVDIRGAGTFAVQLQAPGEARFSRVRASGLGAAGGYDCDSGFTIVRGDDNRGWDEVTCGWPEGPLTVAPGELGFDPVTAGERGDPLAVTVRNPGRHPVRIASVSTIGQFRADSGCPALLAGHRSCTVEVQFAPTGGGTRTGLLTVSDGDPAGHTLVRLAGLGLAASGNWAEGKPVEVSSTLPGFLPEWITDANPMTYWESLNGAFPQTVTVDLGAEITVDRVVLRLPPVEAWGRRTQVVEILTSVDGETFTTVAPATGLELDAATGNRVEVGLPDPPARWVRLVISDNTGWPAAQLAELEVYAP